MEEEGELGRSVGDTRERGVLEQLVVVPSWSFSGPLTDWCSEVMVPRDLRGDMLLLSLRAGDLDTVGELSKCGVSETGVFAKLRNKFPRKFYFCKSIQKTLLSISKNSP